jgi:hypothetical protein
MTKSKTQTIEILNAPRYIDRVSGFSRDLNGFINSVEYIFNDDSTINWRAMIRPEYLVPNRDSFKNKPDLNLKDLDVTSLADNQLLILLAGIKELAQIRGFSSVDYEVLESRPDYVSVKCTINFIGNYETGFQPVTFSALADAHWDNTYNFAKNFLMAIAENRAFVRTVRSFLKVNIVGSDEMGVASKPAQSTEDDSNASSHPVALLQKTMNDYGLSFAQIKEGSIKKNIEGAGLWNDCNDIPPLSIFTIISGIKTKNAKR